eukprot:s248_g10.t1
MLEEPWVLDLAEQHGLRNVVEEQRERKRLADRREKEFKGISRFVSPGKLGHGILTDWTKEEDYYRKGAFDAPEKTSHSSFSLHVDKVLAFPNSISTHSPQRFHSDLWAPGRFDLEQILMWSGKTHEEIEAHFGKSTQEIMVFLQKPMALRVPILLCHLIAKGAWRATVFNGGDFGKKGAQETLHLAFQERLGGYPAIPPQSGSIKPSGATRRQELQLILEEKVLPTTPEFTALVFRVRQALQGDLAAALSAFPKESGTSAEARATSPTEAGTPPTPTSPAAPAAPPRSSDEGAQAAKEKESKETEKTEKAPPAAGAETSASVKVEAVSSAETQPATSVAAQAASDTGAQERQPRRKKRRKHKGCKLSEPEGPEEEEESAGSRRRCKSDRTGTADDNRETAK